MGKKVLPDEDLGPLGLGDPYSTKLRIVEKDVMIPKIVREKIKKIKCAKEVQEFEECCKAHQVLNFHVCKPYSKIMFECYDRWFKDEEFIKECTIEYLKQRKEYRLTGIGERWKRLTG